LLDTGPKDCLASCQDEQTLLLDDLSGGALGSLIGSLCLGRLYKALDIVGELFTNE
jgi:hypothetical protein